MCIVFLWNIEYSKWIVDLRSTDTDTGTIVHALEKLEFRQALMPNLRHKQKVQARIVEIL